MSGHEPAPLEVPALSLLVLSAQEEGTAAAFAARHFRPGEVFTLPDPATEEDRAHLLERVGERLTQGWLSAVLLDGGSGFPADSFPADLVRLAHSHDVATVAIVLEPAGTLLWQYSPPPGQGFAAVYRLSWPSGEELSLRRVPLPVDRRELSGPFDLIGDVHGCLPELLTLLSQLGYQRGGPRVVPPPGRRAVFLGDLVDRGPDTPGVLELVMGMVAEGTALCVCGNHDDKLARALAGRPVSVTQGMEVSLEQLEARPPAFREAAGRFLSGLPSHLLLDGGRLVAAHAGLIAPYQGRDSRRVRAFALYGDTDGTLDPSGRPRRRNWAAAYRGEALVAYGHTPVPEPLWQGRTVNLDTGCVYGGRLSALRYPEGLDACEGQTLSVPARAMYREAASRPAPAPGGWEG